MDNVSKMLIIAAGVLITVLTINVATVLFRSATNMSKTYFSTEQISEINTFNSNFTRFVGAVQEENDDGTLTENRQYATIYDVVTAANFAWNYNMQMVIDPLNVPEDESERILHINIHNSENDGDGCDDLQNCTQETFDNLLQNCYYKIGAQTSSNIMHYKVNIDHVNGDGRINEVTFYPEIEDNIDLYINDGNNFNLKNNID